jgi:hypothetical protein
MTRLMRDWRALQPEQRLAGGAGVALFVTMLLPWYQQNAVVNAPRAAPLQSRNLNAFQVFSFVEAAVLLVALAVLYLLYARAEGREFDLPGGDGVVVLAAGMWTALLLVLRLFDKPGIDGHGVAANVGVQWGIFFALAAAGLLAYAGSRMRTARRPEPPLRRAHGQRRQPDPGEVDTRSQPDPGGSRRRPHAEEEVTTLAPAPKPAQAASERRSPGGRQRYPPAPSEQMSFEDPPPGSD